MCEQVEIISERYESLETRRKREAEGYQADISTLKQKLKHLEQQLVRATIKKAKGKFIIAFRRFNLRKNTQSQLEANRNLN